MITLLTGDNSFEIDRVLARLSTEFDGTAEKYDGDSLQLVQLPDLLMGGTLFAEKRLVIIRNVSENKPLWDVLPDWISRVSGDVHLVLVETSPDKRTKTYKELKQHAHCQAFTRWGDRDGQKAEEWVHKEAAQLGLTMDKKSVRFLVARIGVDQWQLFHALEKLAVLGEASPQAIESVIEAQPAENVFNLLDSALRGDSKKVHTMIQTLQRTQDPYMTFGLLCSQVYQLVALTVSDKQPAEVASDLGGHPYAVTKLAPHAKKLTNAHVKNILQDFADTDSVLKSSGSEPWILIEKTLIKTASI